MKATILTLLISWTVICPSQLPDYFERPRRKVDADGRISPNPAWITTKWQAAADKPFLSIEREIEPYKRFKGFEDGKWQSRALKAFEAWRRDHQDPVKLYRASAYVGVASEVDRQFSKHKDLKQIVTDLNHGWEIIKNPPESFLFVRMGYRWSGGDGDKHIYGNLARALLKRDPLDRPVAKSAVGELWDEWILRGHKPNDLPQFESFLINTLMRIRKTNRWRPWDDNAIASVYHTRATRTRKRSDMQKAIDYTKSAIAKSPPGYDTKHLQDNLAMCERRMKSMMKYD